MYRITHLRSRECNPAQDPALMPRPIPFALPPLAPHSHNHIPSFPLDILVRLAREDLLEALGCATGDMHGEGMLGLDDLFAVA
jgi:hypothetical protein